MEDVKTILHSYRQAKRRYETTRRQLEECETMLTSISIDYSREKVQTSPDYDRIAEQIDKLSYLRNKCIERGSEAVRTMERVVELIDSVEDSTLHELLVRRYMVGQTWEAIAVSMNYSWQHIHRLHAKALAAVKTR